MLSVPADLHKITREERKTVNFRGEGGITALFPD
jgi:hypothetical protein